MEVFSSSASVPLHLHAPNRVQILLLEAGDDLHHLRLLLRCCLGEGLKYGVRPRRDCYVGIAGALRNGREKRGFWPRKGNVCEWVQSDMRRYGVCAMTERTQGNVAIEVRSACSHMRAEMHHQVHPHELCVASRTLGASSGGSLNRAAGMARFTSAA